MGDGDGWAVCDQGHRHWGRFGAAGLLLYRTSGADVEVLLQHRSWWSIGGNTWGVLGGARHSDEDAVTAALREASEESTLDPSTVRVHGVTREDHGGWWYDTVVGSTGVEAEVDARSLETREVAWVPVDKVSDMKLFAPFAAQWPRLGELLHRTVLVVDAANVMGSRPDGWWRDRAGAAARLRDELAGRPAWTDLPESGFDRCYPRVVLVVEGAARGVEARDGVEVVAAPGSGDDAIVEVVRSRAADEQCLVATADRELRERCRAAGGDVIGPRRVL